MSLKPTFIKVRHAHRITNPARRIEPDCPALAIWVLCKPMRHAVAHRVFASVLMLSRLVLADFVHLPAVQAAPNETGDTMTMTGMPCHDQHGRPAVDSSGRFQGADHQIPTDDGTCCKSSQCPCLHAPALTTNLEIPAVSFASLPYVVPPPIPRVTGHQIVLFRPPI